MSDELEGWGPYPFGGGLRKVIFGQTFLALEYQGKFFLRMPGYTLAERPTLQECQHLAHATARLWAGDTT